MGHHEVGAVIINYLPELWQDAEVKTPALRNDFYGQSQFAGGRHKFVWRFSSFGLPFKSDYDAVDCRKVGGAMTEVLCRAMELQNAFRDGIDRSRFDQRKDFEG